MELEDFKEKLAAAFEDDVQTLLDILEVDVRDLLDKLDDEIHTHRECFPWVDEGAMEDGQGELNFGD